MHTSLPATHKARIVPNPVDFVVIFICLVTLFAMASFAFWQGWHRQRIYTGVSVAGEPVGGMTRSAAIHYLRRTVQQHPVPPITLSDGRHQWPLEPTRLTVEADWQEAVNQAYLVGRSGDWPQRLLDQALTFLNSTAILPRLQVQEAPVRSFVQQVADAVRQPAQTGVQSGNLSVAGQAGVDVDVEQTVQHLMYALQAGQLAEPINLPLALLQVQPSVASAPNPSVASLNLLDLPESLRHGLRLRNEQFALDFALDPIATRRLIAAINPFTVDELALRSLLSNWARQLNIPAIDARLRLDPNSGGLTVLRPSQPGRRLDLDASYLAIQDALRNGQSLVPLSVVEVPPAVDMNRTAEMGIQDLVASASTYFKGSSVERVRNIATGAAKFEGVVIPPNGIFSFNSIVEDVSSANGFEDSLVIWGDQTTNGVGGGICQVSTTIFRAAFSGGFPIVERYNHSYTVRWYGEPGLDATIFTPSVDFRFRNDTGAYLLIDPIVDAENGVITFNFYGTKPARVVTVGTPVQSDFKTSPPPQYRLDETLPASQKKQVEWENKGMTVKVTRTIAENGTTREETITSKYAPWGAVYLYGPGFQPPVPLPTPTPVAGEIPVAPSIPVTP